MKQIRGEVLGPFQQHTLFWPQVVYTLPLLALWMGQHRRLGQYMIVSCCHSCFLSLFSPAPFSSCISSALALVLHSPSPLGLPLPQHVSPQPQSPQRPLFLFYLIYLNIFIPGVVIKPTMGSSGTCLCSAKPRLGLVGWTLWQLRVPSALALGFVGEERGLPSAALRAQEGLKERRGSEKSRELVYLTLGEKISP